MTTSVDTTYALLSAIAYEDGRSAQNLLTELSPNGAAYVNDVALAHHGDTVSGFEASAFAYDGKVVIAFAGTLIDGVAGSIPDLMADGMLGLGLPELQIREAAAFYERVKAKYGDNIVFTGHSLGGGLAALMGVFFNKPAMTFDPAPFRLSATQGTAHVLRDYLATQGFAADSDLAGFTTSETALSAAMPSLIPAMLGVGLISAEMAVALSISAYPVEIRGESNIVAVATSGEFLTTAFPPFTADQFDGLRIKNGPVQLLDHGGVGTLGGGVTEGFQLHSVTLLTLLATHPEFESLSKELPDLVPLLLDAKLYAQAPRNEATDVLVKLLRDQYAVTAPVDVLTKLSKDLSKLGGGEGAATYSSIRDSLIIAALEYYYLKDRASVTELFKRQDGALHFKYSDIGAASYKSLPRLAMAVGDLVEENIKTRVVAALKRENAWHIQQGAEGMTWSESANQNDAAIGGSGVDLLDGGVGNDVLLGGVGSDVLKGGAGDDILFGGVGIDSLTGGDGSDLLAGGLDFDTYNADGATGTDTVVDTDGQGVVYLTYTKAGLAITAELKGGKAIQSNVWQSDSGDIFYTLVPRIGGGNDLLVWTADRQLKIENFTDGMLGISLSGTAPAPTRTTFTGTGGNDQPGDYGESGFEGAKLIMAGAGNDYVINGDFNDKLVGEEGDDVLISTGGDDELEGGLGSDMLQGGDGNDVLKGGEGNNLMAGGLGTDVILGGSGTDIVFGGGGQTVNPTEGQPVPGCQAARSRGSPLHGHS